MGKDRDERSGMDDQCGMEQGRWGMEAGPAGEAESPV